MATPLLLLLPCENMIWLPHSVFHFFSNSLEECVSCRKIICHKGLNLLNMAFLLISFLNPFTLNEVSFIEDSQFIMYISIQ